MARVLVEDGAVAARECIQGEILINLTRQLEQSAQHIDIEALGQAVQAELTSSLGPATACTVAIILAEQLLQKSRADNPGSADQVPPDNNPSDFGFSGLDLGFRV